MPKFKDPSEIYQESLANAPARQEEHPPVIQRAEVWPYPDLVRLWVRLETSSFVAFPNASFGVFNPDGTLVSSLYIVELRESYLSVTMHLRQGSRPGERYLLHIQLSRDETILDERKLGFDLVHRDPRQVQQGDRANE